MIVLDASDGELHRIAAPIYQAAIERSDELAAALLKRGESLEAAGYHQQVKVTPSSVLVFTLQNGARTAIHSREQSDEFLIGSGGEGDAEKISQTELLSRVDSAPEQFNPNVLLRPSCRTICSPLLPTPAAPPGSYFAAGTVYSLLGRASLHCSLLRHDCRAENPAPCRALCEITVLDVSTALTLCVANLAHNHRGISDRF